MAFLRDSIIAFELLLVKGHCIYAVIIHEHHSDLTHICLFSGSHSYSSTVHLVIFDSRFLRICDFVTFCEI